MTAKVIQFPKKEEKKSSLLEIIKFAHDSLEKIKEDNKQKVLERARETAKMLDKYKKEKKDET